MAEVGADACPQPKKICILCGTGRSVWCHEYGITANVFCFCSNGHFFGRFGGTVFTCVCGVVSTLGLILCPNKEMPILFLCLLGYYPVLKIWLDKKFHRSRWLVLLRLLLANISIGIAYGTMIKILGLNYVVEEFANTGRGILVLLFVLTNMAIVVFDLAMEQLCVLYCNKISPKLHKTMWHS